MHEESMHYEIDAETVYQAILCIEEKNSNTPGKKARSYSKNIECISEASNKS